MSWSSSHQRQIQAEKLTRRKDRYLWGPCGFVLGWLASLIFNQSIAPLLPGPRARLDLTQAVIHAGNATGCTSYAFKLMPGGDLDSSYIRIAFPGNIKDVQIGFPLQAITSESDFGLQAWDIGRNPGGECAIHGQAVDIQEGITFVKVTNVLTIRTSKIAESPPVMGIVLVPTHESLIASGKPIFTGNYQYIKWGQTVTRNLPFEYFTETMKND